MWNQKRILKLSFLLAAIADAWSILPLLFPPLTKLTTGIENISGGCRLIMGEGASLMLGWTLLLIWAYLKPIERKGVALLTIIVLLALFLNEIIAVSLGHATVWKMLPAWILQAILLSLFFVGYYYNHFKRWFKK